MKAMLTTSPYSLWENILEELDKKFDEFEPCIPNKVSNAICSSGFPKSDIYEDEDNALHINLAVAGIEKERMEISFDKDYLTWKLKKVEVDKDENGKEIIKEDKRKWIQKGIKNPDTASVSFFINQTKYDVNQTVIDLSDGILKIKIPKKDSYVTKASFVIS